MVTNYIKQNSVSWTHINCKPQSGITIRKKVTGLEAFCGLVSMMVRHTKSAALEVVRLASQFPQKRMILLGKRG